MHVFIRLLTCEPRDTRAALALPRRGGAIDLVALTPLTAHIGKASSMASMMSSARNYSGSSPGTKSGASADNVP